MEISKDIYMHNPTLVAEKINKIVSASGRSLQIISDFDMTLTKLTVNGKPGYTSHKVLEKYSKMDAEYTPQAAALHQYYYPIEINPLISVAEKEPMMVEWWTKGHNLLINAGINEHSYQDAVHEANIGFRDGVDEMFKLAREKSIHVLIFSAGLKTIIQEVIKEKLPGALEVSRIVANDMIHDSDGKLVAFG